MRVIFIILFAIVLFFSCNSSSVSVASGVQNDTVRLKNGMGLITLDVPSRYDTFLVWTNRSDCTTCGYEQYRFQKKNFPIFLESGFYWKGDPADSVDEVTISQPIEMLPVNTALMISEGDHRQFVDGYNKDPLYYPITRDTLIDINSRKYSVIYSDHFDSLTMAFRQTLVAECIVGGSNIKFKFRHWAKDSISSVFYEESLSVLRSVKFLNGH